MYFASLQRKRGNENSFKRLPQPGHNQPHTPGAVPCRLQTENPPRPAPLPLIHHLPTAAITAPPAPSPTPLQTRSPALLRARDLSPHSHPHPPQPRPRVERGRTGGEPGPPAGLKPPLRERGGAGRACPLRGPGGTARPTDRRPPSFFPACLLLPCLLPSLPARQAAGVGETAGGGKAGSVIPSFCQPPLHYTRSPALRTVLPIVTPVIPPEAIKLTENPSLGCETQLLPDRGACPNTPPPHTHTGAPPAARPHHFPSLHAVSTDRPVPSSPAGAAPPRQREVLREGERLRPWGFGSCEAGRGGFARLSVWAAGAECSEARARPRRMAASCPLKLSRGPALSPHPGYVPLHPSHHLSHVPVQHTTPQELTSFIFKKPSDEPSEVRPLKGSHPQGRKFDPWCWNSTTRSSRLCCFLLWSMPWHYRENPTGGWGKCMDRKVCLRLALVWWSGCSLKEAFQGPGGLPLLNPQCCDSVCGKGCKSSDSCFRS